MSDDPSSILARAVCEAAYEHEYWEAHIAGVITKFESESRFDRDAWQAALVAAYRARANGRSFDEAIGMVLDSLGNE